MASQHGATTEQLRHDIDQGRTGDKVRFPDPAAAPLGTDEEAAGTPIDPQVIARTREAEAKLARSTDAQRSAQGRVSDVLVACHGCGGGSLVWVRVVAHFTRRLESTGNDTLHGAQEPQSSWKVGSTSLCLTLTDHEPKVRSASTPALVSDG